MANLGSLVLLVHHFGLFFLETQAALGHLGIPKMLPGSLHEHPFHLVTRAGQTHREIQGPLMNLSCQDSPSLREGRQNLYWKTNHFKIRFRSGVSLTKKKKKKILYIQHNWTNANPVLISQKPLQQADVDARFSNSYSLSSLFNQKAYFDVHVAPNLGLLQLVNMFL